MPKYRFSMLFWKVKILVENDIRMFCEWNAIEIFEMNVPIDHVDLVCSAVPKFRCRS
ncbi:transposase [Ferruginibacter sp.]|uniref:transposase n=1 Tax=Ferruginibacter sp. TaxID=1940288 RepID=UPI003467AB27